MGYDSTVVGFDEHFGGCTDELETAAVDVEHVWRGVYSAEMTVDVEGVEGGGSGESLGWDCLNDLSFDNVLFQCFHMVFVAYLADVGGILVFEQDGRLRWFGRLFSV